MTGLGLFFILSLLKLISVEIVLCQNNASTVQSSVSDDQDNVLEKEPIVEGMEPLFSMTNGFLSVIQPESKGNKILDIVTAELENNTDGSLAEQDWQELVVHYIGFVICIGIGVVYFIFMPIVGLCFCCCRCCGKCGGKNSYKGKYDRCKQITYGVLFAVVNVLVLAGMVCAFVTNELVRKQTSQDNEALVPTIGSNLKELEYFKDRTIGEIRTDVVGNLADEISDILTILGNIPEQAKISISESVGVNEVLDKANAVKDRTVAINTSLGNIDEQSSAIQGVVADLNTEIGTFKTNAETTLNGLPGFNCSVDPSCQNLQTKIRNLNTEDYSQLPDVSSQKQSIENVLSTNNLEQKINDGEAELDKITEEVESETSAIIQDSESSANSILSEVESKVDELEDEIKAKYSLNNTIKELEKYEDDVEMYGDYRFYAGIGLSCILLLILLFNVLGLAFGIVGEPPYDDANTCNKGVGANLLLAGVGFTFIFAWVLMLVVIILFLLGGLLHTEACTILVDVEDSTAVNTIDDLLQSQVFENTSLEFKISNVLDNCKADYAVYQALNLDSLVNLTKVLNLNEYDLDNEMDKLRDVTYTLPDLNLYSTDLETALTNLKDAGLDNIDFATFDRLLAQDVTNENLDEILSSLIELRDSQAGSGYQNLNVTVHELSAIISGSNLADVNSHLSNLRTETESLKSNIMGSNSNQTFGAEMDALMVELQEVSNNLRNDFINKITAFIADQADLIIEDVTDFLNQLAYDLQNNIGKCRPLYNSLDFTIKAVCESTLQPFNGFWFSFGWCLILFIPSVIFAVKLAGLYRKFEDYEPRDYKHFDDPNFAAYEGGDNIAMQQRNFPQNGKQNTGYERDDYTASRASNYRADHITSQPSHYPPSSYDPGYNHHGYGDHYNGAPLTPPPNPPHYHNNQRSYQRFEY